MPTESMLGDRRLGQPAPRSSRRTGRGRPAGPPGPASRPGARRPRPFPRPRCRRSGSSAAVSTHRQVLAVATAQNGDRAGSDDGAERRPRRRPAAGDGDGIATARRRPGRSGRLVGDAGRRTRRHPGGRGDRRPRRAEVAARARPGRRTAGRRRVDGPPEGGDLGACSPAQEARCAASSAGSGSRRAARARCSGVQCCTVALQSSPRRSRVRRMWDFTVPSGIPVRSAIWACVRSSKNASSMIPRWGWSRRSSSSSTSIRSATGVSTPAVTGAGGGLQLRHGRLGLAALPLAARPGVGDLVPADARPATPGSGPLVGPVAGAPGPRGDEGLLGDVLGVGAGAEGADRHAVDLTGPALVGQRQGLLLARGEPSTDLPVVRLRDAAVARARHPRRRRYPCPRRRTARSRSRERLGHDDDVVAVAAELRQERPTAGDQGQPGRARRGRRAGPAAGPASG